MLFVPISLRYLERIWGSIETIKFIVVTITFSNIIAFGFNWIEYFALRNADLLLCVSVFYISIGTDWFRSHRYGMQYRGQMALQIGILVAFTQLMPEHQVQVMGVLKARVKVRILETRTKLCLLT